MRQQYFQNTITCKTISNKTLQMKINVHKRTKPKKTCPGELLKWLDCNCKVIEGWLRGDPTIRIMNRNQFSLRHLILVDIVDTEGVEKAQSCDLMPSNSDPGLK